MWTIPIYLKRWKKDSVIHLCFWSKLEPFEFQLKMVCLQYLDLIPCWSNLSNFIRYFFAQNDKDYYGTSMHLQHPSSGPNLDSARIIIINHVHRIRWVPNILLRSLCIHILHCFFFEVYGLPPFFEVSNCAFSLKRWVLLKFHSTWGQPRAATGRWHW